MLLPHDPVQASIIHALENYFYEDAVFLGERLFAEAPTDSTLFLLANCYYQSGRKSQAYKFFRNKGFPTAKCKYLYSKCCFDMGKLSEAEFVLTGDSSSKTKGLEEFVSEYGDIASFAISLLADIYRKTERHIQALEMYQNSLILNPFLWSSFSKMCRMGAKPDPSLVFHSDHVPEALNSVKSVLFSPYVPQQNLQNMSNSQRVTNSTSTPTSVTPIISVTTPSEILDSPQPLTDKSPALFQTDLVNTPEAPSFGVALLYTPIMDSYQLTTPNMASPPINLDVPKAPNKKTLRCQLVRPSRPLPTSKPVFGQSSSSNTKNDAMPPPSTRQNVPSIIPRRRSKRILDNQNSSSVKENNKLQTRSKYSSPKSSVRKTKSCQPVKICSQDELNCKNKAVECDGDSSMPSTISASLEMLDCKQKQSAGAFLNLLQDVGSAYSASQSYDMRSAISRFEAIPHRQYKTGWVLSEVGRAYLELAEYSKAEEVFEELRKLEPHQQHGMETYSTVLFHLQKEVALSSLSQEMVNTDKLCPETWCVAGNCFSLQKEHETAIKCLQRAIQVDEEFAYAYTLLGHEYTLIEDYEKAMSAFRSALRVDSRHYNAWYGLGMIYYKKEKFSLAETHFKKALSINSESAVLLCHIGLVQHALQRHDAALSTLNRAVELGPKNPMCLFHRASMLVANDRLDKALQELESLKVITPKESLVYFLIGKVHKKLGNAHLSMLNFSWATDLDPKGANNHIKEAIDRRYVTDDDEDEDDSMSPSIDASILMGRTPDGHLSTDTSVLMDSDEAHHLHAAESDDSL